MQAMGCLPGGLHTMGGLVAAADRGRVRALPAVRWRVVGLDGDAGRRRLRALPAVRWRVDGLDGVAGRRRLRALPAGWWVVAALTALAPASVGEVAFQCPRGLGTEGSEASKPSLAGGGWV